MQRRTLGKSGIEVSPLGLGCWAMGGTWSGFGQPLGWGEVNDEESKRAIRYALENEINFFDTAANYGTGHSETILGEALGSHKKDVVIASKFGFRVSPDQKFIEKYTDPRDVIANVKIECEGSLKRLGVECIDLYQLHVWDYPVIHIPELIGRLEELVQEGKIRYYGWSTDVPENAKAIAQGAHCTAIQHDLNVVIDAPGILEICKSENLASIDRSPLARGALTGKYNKSAHFHKDDVRSHKASMQKFFEPSLKVLDDIKQILTSDGRTIPQGALAWIWARSPATVPIPGFKTVKQVRENVAAIEKGPLKKRYMEQLDAILEEARKEIAR